MPREIALRNELSKVSNERVSDLCGQVLELWDDILAHDLLSQNQSIYVHFVDFSYVRSHFFNCIVFHQLSDEKIEAYPLHVLTAVAIPLGEIKKLIDRG